MSTFDLKQFNITLGSGSSGLTIFATPKTSFNCVEFTLKADVPQPIFISPWMQFEPPLLLDFRQQIAGELVRRALVYDDLIKQQQNWSRTLNSFHHASDRHSEEVGKLQNTINELQVAVSKKNEDVERMQKALQQLLPRGDYFKEDGVWLERIEDGKVEVEVNWSTETILNALYPDEPT